MTKHPIRNFLGLTVLYSLIILGIFLAQFRTEATISQTIGELRLQLEETQITPHRKGLANFFRATFKGLILTADETDPATLTAEDGTEAHLKLIGWQKTSDSTIVLSFTEEVLLYLSVTPGQEGGLLSIQAHIPEDAQTLSLPYKPAGGYLVTTRDLHKASISSKSRQYEITSYQITPHRIVFDASSPLAVYSLHSPQNSFDFSLAGTLPLGKETAYKEALGKFKEDFIRLASQSLTDAMPENLAIAYMAAMAETGKYRQAMDSIPDAVKTAPRRTYLSSPYFNSLVALGQSLDMQVGNWTDMISYALEKRNLNIFTLQNLAEILCITENSPETQEVLALPTEAEQFSPTAIQAAGILETYSTLFRINKSMALKLEPALPACLNAIAQACIMEDGLMRLQEKDAAISLLDAVSIGMALVAYGQEHSMQDLMHTGYLIVNSYLESDISANLHVMTELYPIIAYDNHFYPHIQILANAKDTGGEPLWAWTIAQRADFSMDSSGTITISLEFLPGESHHTIIKGVRPFQRIVMHGITFRSDPRFEGYQSSGYVYHADTDTLFLKSLHKAREERVSLHYQP